VFASACICTAVIKWKVKRTDFYIPCFFAFPSFEKLLFKADAPNVNTSFPFGEIKQRLIGGKKPKPNAQKVRKGEKNL